MKQTLLEKLEQYVASDAYPFHMPGHKRRTFFCEDKYEEKIEESSEERTEDKTKEKTTGNAGVDSACKKTAFPSSYHIDITEIDGFDNLHHPEGILKESMEEAARSYGVDKSYYLVNGSTCGILSAVCGCVRNGGTILMARNCHKAAYHAAILHRLDVEYVYPKYLKEYGFCGGISAEDVREILKRTNGKLLKKIEAVLIVSPTYEGVVSDIQAIADVTHEYGIPLIVDEAHGAHFPFAARDDIDEKNECRKREDRKGGDGKRADRKYLEGTFAETKGPECGFGFPKSALECGADVVIQSLHKTLPSFTQTAILHLKGNLVKPEQIQRYLGMFQTSSPSYVFLAGMESCIRFMDETGREEMKRYEGRLKDFFEKMKHLRTLRVVDHGICRESSVFDWDMSKIIISLRNVGTQRYERRDMQVLQQKKEFPGWEVQDGDWIQNQKNGDFNLSAGDIDSRLNRRNRCFDGNVLGNLLREHYHLEVEMCAWNYVIAMTSLMDTQDGLNRLADALEKIDEALECGCFGVLDGIDATAENRCIRGPEDAGKMATAESSCASALGRMDGVTEREQMNAICDSLPPAVSRMPLAEALDAGSRRVPVSESAGMVSAEFVYLYPPGIPIAAPGEVITDEMVRHILWYREHGFSVQGLSDMEASSILTVADK